MTLNSIILCPDDAEASGPVIAAQVLRVRKDDLSLIRLGDDLATKVFVGAVGIVPIGERAVLDDGDLDGAGARQVAHSPSAIGRFIDEFLNLRTQGPQAVHIPALTAVARHWITSAGIDF